MGKQREGAFELGGGHVRLAKSNFVSRGFIFLAFNQTGSSKYGVKTEKKIDPCGKTPEFHFGMGWVNCSREVCVYVETLNPHPF